MRYIIWILIPLIMLTGCEQTLLEKIKEDDIKSDGLHYEFEKLYQLGIEGISKDENNQIIFYVAKPNDTTRRNIDQGLMEIFGQTIDYILRDSEELNVEIEPSD
ncbi:hypothetical protein [Litchfieldia alkalitelluris]|uniref:hypothetical protein n=1 Tax=Litchfieldia alkalitelluris TaxID=304268 RepID=UPI000997504C|nr:hypothetical protein [Litchfieldia alkalitelluris]